MLVELEVVEKCGERNSTNRIKRSQNRQQPIRENQSSRAAKQRQQHAFGEKLPDETPPTSAKRATECELALTGDAARQLQVRHVRATDEQKEPNPRHEDKQCSAHVPFQIAKQFLTERNDFHAPAATKIGIFLLQLTIDRFQFRICLSQTHAGS